MTVISARRVLLAVAVSVCCMRSAAYAATPVFADSVTPNCHGRGVAGVSCFTSIQAAVNHAGPPPAVVNVFQGNYFEDVVLNNMGSAIGGSPGDITLQTVNAAGLPAPGTATVEGVQSAIGLSGAFNASVTIDGFILTSQVNAAINLFNITGDVEIANVSVKQGGFNGIVVGGIATSVDIHDTTALQNSGIGIDVFVRGPVMLRSVLTNGNGSRGIAVTTLHEVTIETATSSGNSGFGADISAGAAVMIRKLTASNNAFGAGVDTPGSITIEDSVANGNNGGDGFDLTSGGAITVYDSTADRNKVDGLDATASEGITVTRTSASGNGADGMNLFAVLGPTLQHVWVNDNQDDGIVITTPQTVAIDDASASRNKGHGINISAGQSITIGNSAADGNAGSGIKISSGTDLSIDPTSASGNHLNGVDAVLDGHATVGSLSASDNGGFGFTIQTVEGLSLSASNLLRNATGLRLAGPERASFAVHCNNIAQNTSAGLESETLATTNAENDWWGAPTGPQHPSNPGGTGDAVIDGANGGVGTVDFRPFLFGPFQNVGVCGGRISQAPAMDTAGLAVCGLALFALGYGVLARRRCAAR